MSISTSFKSLCLCVCLVVLTALSLPIFAQQPDAAPKVLAGAELSKMIPASFYFEGQSAPVQLRNSAAARISADKHVMAGLVDTSGYAAGTRAKCQGFLTIEMPVKINGSEVRAGSYGMGFADGKMNIYDLGGSLITSPKATTDSALRRPRPLMMVKSADGVRLYVGREYVVINSK